MGLYGIPTRVEVADLTSRIHDVLSDRGYVVNREGDKDVFTCETKHGRARFWIRKGVPPRWCADLSPASKAIAAMLEQAGVFMGLEEYFAKYHSRPEAE